MGLIFDSSVAIAAERRPTRSRVTFATLATEWQATVLPMYKHSTQKHRRFMLKKHLLPRFDDQALSEITRQEIHPKWALTLQQAAALLDRLPPLGRAMVGLAILSGLRRGELFALRRKDIDECARVLTVREAVYDGTFSTPKTEAGQRQIPLSAAAPGFIGEWKERAGRTEQSALVFATRTGNSISPNNVLRRAIFPACEALALPHATWLTFRRTYSSWSHDKGVPGNVRKFGAPSTTRTCDLLVRSLTLVWYLVGSSVPLARAEEWVIHGLRQQIVH